MSILTIMTLFPPIYPLQLLFKILIHKQKDLMKIPLNPHSLSPTYLWWLFDILNLLLMYIVSTYSIYLFMNNKNMWQIKFTNWISVYTSWRMDWWPSLAGMYVTVQCFKLSYLVHTFIFIFIIYINLFSKNLQFGKWSLIKPFWFSDQIPEPTFQLSGLWFDA